MIDDRLAAELERARQRRALPSPRVRRLLRERAGLTQCAMARAIGVDRAALARWERGERTPRDPEPYLRALGRLREALSA